MISDLRKSTQNQRVGLRLRALTVQLFLSLLCKQFVVLLFSEGVLLVSLFLLTLSEYLVLHNNIGILVLVH